MIGRFVGVIFGAILGLLTGLIFIVQLPFAVGSFARYRRIRAM